MTVVNKRQIAYNRTKRSQKPVYIVIHDTGNTGKGADANAHFNHFNGGDRGSSADFFVDDTQALQVNDYNTYYTWHCGDGKGKYGITNGNSVGVEMCINSDGNYSAAFQNTVELTKQLMSELGIDADHVVRHYDASRKNCPASMSGNGWALWRKFKNMITEEDGMMSKEYDELNRRLTKVENPMVYNYIDDNMPAWAKPTIQKMVDKGFLQGDENGYLGLSEELLRMFVVNDRAGLYDRR